MGIYHPFIFLLRLSIHVYDSRYPCIYTHSYMCTNIHGHINCVKTPTHTCMNIHTSTIDKNRNINGHNIYAYETSHTLTQYRPNTCMLHVHHTDERLLARIHISNIDNFPTKLRLMHNLMNNLVEAESLQQRYKQILYWGQHIQSLIRRHRCYFVRCSER